MKLDDFIERWQGSGGSEIATAQSFAIELTELQEVPRPNVKTMKIENGLPALDIV